MIERTEGSITRRARSLGGYNQLVAGALPCSRSPNTILMFKLQERRLVEVLSFDASAASRMSALFVRRLIHETHITSSLPVRLWARAPVAQCQEYSATDVD